MWRLQPRTHLRNDRLLTVSAAANAGAPIATGPPAAGTDGDSFYLGMLHPNMTGDAARDPVE